MTVTSEKDAASDEFDAFTRLAILDEVGCGIWVYDGEEIRYANRALELMTGYSRQNLLQPKFFEQMLHPDHAATMLERGKARVRGEDVPPAYESALVAKDGRTVHLAISARHVELPTGPVSIVSAVDISGRKEAEAAIGVVDARYLALLDTVPAHVITTDAAGKPTWVNQYWLDYTGLSLETSMESGTSSIIHPDDMSAATRAWMKAQRKREGYDIDYRIQHRSGHFRWQSWRIRPILEADGTLLGWTSACIDIDDAKRLQLELEETNVRLQLANDAKDEFLGLVSHELRTPLTTIAGLAQVLERRDAELTPEDRRGVLQQLRQDSERLQTLIENLLVLARLDTTSVELEPVLAHRVVEQVVEAHRQKYTDRPLALFVDDDLPPVAAQEPLLRLVVENLIGNAEKYSPGEAPIEVSVSASAGRLRVGVSDRGQGISVEDAERVFDPFFRSAAAKVAAAGAGLGLAVCKRLVELHNGTIGVRAREGGGSEFAFELPAIDVGAE